MPQHTWPVEVLYTVSQSASNSRANAVLLSLRACLQRSGVSNLNRLLRAVTRAGRPALDLLHNLRNRTQEFERLRVATVCQSCARNFASCRERHKMEAWAGLNL